jgi:hypothetical protein
MGDITFTANHERVAELQAQLAAAGSAADTAVVVELAWHMRQRDTALALQLADSARVRLSDLNDGGAAQLAARCTLIHAEALWLKGQLAEAEQRLEDARTGFQQVNDAVGEGDACFLAAVVAMDRGDPSRTRSAFAKAESCYAADPIRLDMLAARRLWFEAFIDPLRARSQLAETFGRGSHDNDAVAL